VAAGVVWAQPVSRRAVASLGADFGSWVGANARHVANPAAVGLIRAAVSTTDDVVAGALRAPRRAVDGGLVGIVASPLVAAAARAVDTPVSVAPVGPVKTVAAPTTVADVAARIPANAPGQPQVRIEKYETLDGDASWAVYVGSTVEFGVGESEEPFDLESAIGTMAGEDGAAYRAVVQAMDDAGVGASDPITLAGHSQGGLVAAALAESGDYSVDSLVTFGAPSAQIAAADGVPTVAVEHSDDLVPALAGQAPVDDARTVVSRDTLSREQDGDSLLSAHSIEEYTRTAELMDRSDDQRLVEFREALSRSAPAGAPGSSVDYRAERVLP
jgi:alpha/beta superfamily hydrolase